MSLTDRLRIAYHRGSLSNNLFGIWFLAALVGTVLGLAYPAFMGYGIAYLGSSLLLLLVGLQGSVLWEAWKARQWRKQLGERLWLDFNQMDGIPIDAPLKTWGKLVTPPNGFPYRSPLSNTPCLFWSVSIQSSIDGEAWEWEDGQSSEDQLTKQSIWIEQENGQLEIRLSQSKGEIIDGFSLSALSSRVTKQSEDPDDLKRLPRPIKSRSFPRKTYRLVESVVDDPSGCYVAALGASGQSNDGRRFLHSSSDVPITVLLSNKEPGSEDELESLLFRNGIGWKTVLFIVSLTSGLIGPYLMFFYWGLTG